MVVSEGRIIMGCNVELFVSTHNEGELAPIVEKILERYSGLTVVQGIGWWKDSLSCPVQDKVSILRCSVAGWSAPTQAWWHRLAEKVRQRWEQDAVFLTISKADSILITGSKGWDYRVNGE